MECIFPSPIITMTGGAPTPIDLNFVPARSYRGKRLAITKVMLYHAIQVDTDGSTTIEKGGWAAINQRTILRDFGGELVNNTGQELRALHKYENGRFALPDPTAIAVSQSNATRMVVITIDFAPIRALRGEDFAAPVDQFLAIPGGQLLVTAATAAQLGTGGGTTLDSHTLTVVVYCREEGDVESHARREISSFALANAVDNYIPQNGRLMRSLFIIKPADSATGGTTEDATSITVDAYGISQVTPRQLQTEFGLDGQADFTSAEDPFVQTSLTSATLTPKGIPVVWPKRRAGKILDMPFHGGQPLLRLTGSTVTGNYAVTDFLVPHSVKNSEVSRAVAAASGGKLLNELKTDGKSNRNPESYGVYGRFFPVKLASAPRAA